MNWLLLVWILLLSTLPLYAQGQQPDVAKLKGDAQRVASIIKDDKAKTEVYCEAGGLGEQLDKANQEKDSRKAEELSQKLHELEKNLGPEYVALIESLGNENLTSEDSGRITSAFDTLDASCPH
jgi:hypothetical protein